MVDDKIINSEIILEYKAILKRIIPLSFPGLTEGEIDESINYSINKRFKNHDIKVDNNYKKTIAHNTILDITNYILDKKPIMTSQGVLFRRHGSVPNPLYTMVDGFISERKAMKKEMFKYPKGSDMYEKYNLLQLLLKIDANGLYGVLGQHTSLYYNLYVASSITTQGRSAISAAALLFESFFNNNVPFGSLNELITFIDNVRREPRKYNDAAILNESITLEESFFKVMSSVGFGFFPDEEDCNIVWDIMRKLSQEDLNRLYYKNNLFSFMDNRSMQKAIVYILQKMELPYLDPNTIPKEIKAELEEFWDLLKEYVYYDGQIIDRLDKLDSLVRSVVAVIDTDSNILSLDGWYRYVLNIVKDVPMTIKHEFVNPVKFLEVDEFDDMELTNPVDFIDPDCEYDFVNDEIIEKDRLINPGLIIPQDGLMYSIINVMAYCASQMILDYMEKYVICSNADFKDKKCLLIMKNEFYFGRLMLPDAKKNYSTLQFLQEGNFIPEDKQLDVKGLPAFTKSTMNATTRKKLKSILLEDIMKPEEVDQIKILKDIAILEKRMFDSIRNGEKEYYKPARIKSLSNYENPMRIQGIKASLAYNYIKDHDMEAIDLEARNSVTIIKCTITPKNVEQIRESFPETCDRMKALMNTKDFDGGIDAIALPLNEDVPKWILPFVDYSTIISDNVSLFPLECVGLYRGNKSNNHTNILSIT